MLVTSFITSARRADINHNRHTPHDVHSSRSATIAHCYRLLLLLTASARGIIRGAFRIRVTSSAAAAAVHYTAASHVIVRPATEPRRTHSCDAVQQIKNSSSAVLKRVKTVPFLPPCGSNVSPQGNPRLTRSTPERFRDEYRNKSLHKSTGFTSRYVLPAHRRILPLFGAG